MVDLERKKYLFKKKNAATVYNACIIFEFYTSLLHEKCLRFVRGFKKVSFWYKLAVKHIAEKGWILFFFFFKELYSYT